MPRARVANDADKYIRRVKNGKYQARPYMDEESRRVNLGLFETNHQARKAILEFWWGRRQPRLRFARPVRIRCGRTVWIAVVRLPQYLCPPPPDGSVPRGKTYRIGERFATAKEAHDAAVAWIRATVTKTEDAEWLISGGETVLSKRAGFRKRKACFHPTPPGTPTARTSSCVSESDRATV